MDSVQAEHAVLRQTLDRAFRVLIELDADENEAASSSGTMAAFLNQAKQICDDLDTLIDSVKTKYTNVLLYFGEDQNLPSSEFFSTLSKFVQEFCKERDVLERQRKADLRKTTAASGSKEKLAGDLAAAGGAAQRRASIQLGGASQKMAQSLLQSRQEGGAVSGGASAEPLPSGGAGHGSLATPSSGRRPTSTAPAAASMSSKLPGVTGSTVTTDPNTIERNGNVVYLKCS
jgi:hypothetical protein